MFITTIKNPLLSVSAIRHDLKRRFFSTGTRIILEKPFDIREKEEQITSKIEKLGFTILCQNYPTSEQTFRNLCEHFGAIQDRTSAKKGISYVVNKENSLSKPYSVVSNMHFFPHTDGAYLKSVTRLQEGYRKICPPKFLILECEKPAEKGGESMLIDAKVLLKAITQQSPTLVEALLTPAISFFRHNHLAHDVAIFEKDKEGRYMIRYSYDQEMLAPKRLLQSLSYFNTHFVSNPEYHIYEKLTKGEVLIIDNKRMLHGRCQFFGKRRLKRCWIHDETQSVLLNRIEESASTFFASERNTIDPMLIEYGLPLKRELSSAPLAISTGFRL